MLLTAALRGQAVTIHSRIEITNADDLEKRIAAVPRGLVTFDGCPLAGKTTLMNEIGRRLSCPTLDLDHYLNRDNGHFFNALRLPDLERDVDGALSRSAIALVAGICMHRVLEAVDRTAALSLYIQANSPAGIPCDLDTLDAEDGGVFDCDIDFPFSALLQEVHAYHAKYLPRSNADILYIRVSD